EHEAAAREADVAGFAARLAAARAQDQQARAAETSAREELHRLEGQLQLFQADGRRDRLDAAEAEHVHAERALASVEERARAAALLHDTLTAHRDARRARVQAPYQRALEELGRTVFGDPLTITVGEDLTIVSRTVDGVTVPFDSLSGGAQEQLGVLSRLACARLVDGADGAPVIFDDALGHSDPARLGAMADALVEAGRTAQVIVFSCVPGRFDALRGREGVSEVALG
ncbi:ATP-binding protein, partial [Tsukamurella asaccharolytica]|uniref:ATP-binding protein n=1 Tax=Tsukamurella asaccharolytica TaxID=2592067 RepID=UPI0034DCE600